MWRALLIVALCALASFPPCASEQIDLDLYRRYLLAETQEQHSSSQQFITQSKRQSSNGTVDTVYRIAVFNDVRFHLDVVAGLLQSLHYKNWLVTVYMHPLVIQHNTAGFVNLTAAFRTEIRSIDDKPARADLVVLVSPEYNVSCNKLFVNAVKPKAVLAFMHNGHQPNVKDIIKVHARTQLMTLSPHVAQFITKRTGFRVMWALPVLSWRPSKPCITQEQISKNCLKGFAIQGTIASFRRNYSSLWKEMVPHMNTSAPKPAAKKDLRVNILGHGTAKSLQIPKVVEPAVSIFHALPFREYYETIHHSYALIPLFGSDKYYTMKFSSTILASLITGTPIIADQRLLNAYRFFSNTTVYYQPTGAEAVESMLKLLSSSAHHLATVRRNLLQLRTILNSHATLVMHQFLQAPHLAGIGNKPSKAHKPKKLKKPKKALLSYDRTLL